ncbi:SEC-C domain-containing protein [Sedimentibacter sp. zth1]|uniref:SEC-C metal-binding domain-containing protein n=1 Tax=Sedimentibacter sp. zth1 TaxID=2816908 RepID=UPI001A9184FC|nr:SEC-C metal-binding domain-containing protein [Sedimentibacter sp. zth1]QSX04984.1 SEC-C domain-containing protein [Sedimentibacter sp. zth1]
MSLYTEWNNDLEGIQTQEDYKEFWDKYMVKETEIYKQILNSKTQILNGSVKELAEKYNSTSKQFVGFLDGANTSFKEKVEVENITEDTVINAEFDFEKLLWNMHEAKAEWLFGLKEWDNIIDEEQRKKIRKEFNRSKQAVKEVKVGRNDPCPCGSGKKYKKCCGKNI